MFGEKEMLYYVIHILGITNFNIPSSTIVQNHLRNTKTTLKQTFCFGALLPLSLELLLRKAPPFTF